MGNSRTGNLRLEAGTLPAGRARLDLLSLLLFVPLAATLGGAVFPALVPEVSSASYWWMTALTLIGFVISILLRLMLATLAARFIGIPTTASACFLFGPLLTTPRQATDPARQAVLATVDLVGLLLLGSCFLALFTSAFGDQPALVAIAPAFVLAAAHFGLFVLHLLPALPLAGGRLLQAVLARGNRRSPDRATHLAARPGRILAGVLVAGGLALVVTNAFLTGFWLAAGGAVLWRGLRFGRRPS